MINRVSILIGLLFMVLFLSSCGLLGSEETPPPDVSELPQETVSPAADEPALPTPTLAPATSTPTVTPPPTPVVQRIQFAPGATSATREGALAAGQEHVFVFSANGGQGARVELASSGDMANFYLAAMDASPPLKAADDPARIWQGTLPGTLEYMIAVSAPQATTYSLMLTIEPLDLPVIVDPGSPPSDRCIVAHPGSTSVVTVYLGPSTAFAPVAHLGNWAVVLSSEGGWHQIQIGPGQTGWVRETDVTFAGPCDHVDMPTRIELAESGSPWRNSRSILPGQAHRYLFVGQAGQRVIIDLNSSGQVNFALLGVDSGQPLKRIAIEDRTWEGVLPRTQEYMLTVIPGETAADYELTLALQPAPPLVAIYDDHTGALLGGYKDAFWLDAETTAPALLGGELYELFRDSLSLGQANGSAPINAGGICPGFTLQLTPPAASGALAVAGASWDLAPQLVAPVDLSQADLQAVVDLLATQGLTVSPADLALQQALGTDLDGDGFGEIIVVAARLKDDGLMPAAAAGDYVLVAVLMEIGGQQHAEPLILDAYPQANDLAYPWRYQVSNVLDLNGDGQLEIILTGDRWEGKSTTVYSVGSAGGSTVVLQNSCAE
ncbi:MAG: hypothetical protein ACK2UH_08935 [Candidatus Promineifilaceae bacterium]